MTKFVKILFTVYCAILIISCGGGGNNDNSNQTPTVPQSSPITINYPMTPEMQVLTPGDKVSFLVSLNSTNNLTSTHKSLSSAAAATVDLALTGAANGSYSFDNNHFTLDQQNSTKLVTLTIESSATPAQFNNPQLIANVAGYQTSTPINLDIVSISGGTITFTGGNNLVLSTESNTTIYLVAKGFNLPESSLLVRTVDLSTQANLQLSKTSCTFQKGNNTCEIQVTSNTESGEYQITATSNTTGIQIAPLNITVQAKNTIQFNPQAVSILTQGSGSLESTIVKLTANNIVNPALVTLTSNSNEIMLSTSQCEFIAAAGYQTCYIQINSTANNKGSYTITATTPAGYNDQTLTVHVNKPGTMHFETASGSNLYGINTWESMTYTAILKFVTNTTDQYNIPVNFSTTTGIAINTNESDPQTCHITQNTPFCTLDIDALSYGEHEILATEPAQTQIQGLYINVNKVSLVTKDGGVYTTCFLDPKGSAWCWGNGRSGEMGNGEFSTTNDSPTKVALPEGVTLSQLIIGETTYNTNNYATICGLSNTGQTYCWGYGETGQMGDGTTSISNGTPHKVDQQGISYQSIITTLNSYGSYDSESPTICGLSNGQAYCWGAGNYGQIGNGNKLSQNKPQAVNQPNGVTFKSLVTGRATICGLTETGKVYCWGRSSFGANGDSTDIDTPKALAQGNIAFESIIGLASTYALNSATTFCGLTSDGQTYCWGSNQYGILGDGSEVQQTAVPTKVTPQLTEITQLNVANLLRTYIRK